MYATLFQEEIFEMGCFESSYRYGNYLILIDTKPRARKQGYIKINSKEINETLTNKQIDFFVKHFEPEKGFEYLSLSRQEAIKIIGEKIKQWEEEKYLKDIYGADIYDDEFYWNDDFY